MFEPIVDEEDRCIDGGGHVFDVEMYRMDFIQHRVYEGWKCSKCGFDSEAWREMDE